MKLRYIKIGKVTVIDILSRDLLGVVFRSEKPRSSIKFIKNRFGNNELIGCEIGIEEGHNSKNILNYLNIKKIYLIDPYVDYFEDDVKSPYDSKYNKKVAHRKLKKYQSKIIWIEKYSSDALNDINEKLDFCYIDGNHDYKHVTEDIKNYYKKLKIGGILAGHDIENGLVPNHDGVVKAVLEFVNKNNLKLYIHAPDWWIIKK